MTRCVGGYMMTDGTRCGELEGLGKWLKNVTSKYIEPVVQAAAPLAATAFGGPAAGAAASGVTALLFGTGSTVASSGPGVGVQAFLSGKAGPSTPMTLAEARGIAAAYGPNRAISSIPLATGRALLTRARAIIAANPSTPLPPPAPPPPPPPPAPSSEPIFIAAAAPAEIAPTSGGVSPMLIGAGLLVAALALRGRK